MERKHPLRAFRDAHGLSQSEAAEMVGITQAQWSRLEQGKRFSRPQVAKRISELTGIALEHLMDFGDSEISTRADQAGPKQA